MILALATAVVAGAASETALIPSAGDNTLYENSTGSVSNGSGGTFFVGDNSQSNTRRGLIRFDVASTLPPDAIVTAVELHLTVASAPNAIPREVAVHRVLDSWGEGSSAGGGQGAPAQPGDATWLHRFFPDSAWAVAGGDFDPSALTSTLVGDIGTFTWSGGALVDAVQSWVDDPDGNLGWMLRGQEGQASSVRSFHSRESPDEAARPVLVVEWEPGSTGVEPMSWARTKAANRQP